jgi:phosphatidate cytidylyltransferase
VIFVLKRILTSVILLPVFIAFIWLNGFFLRFALTVLSLIGMNEVYKALSKKNMGVHIIGYVFCVIYNLVSMSFSILFEIEVIFILTLLIFLVINHKKTNIIDCAVTIFGFFYVPVLFSFISAIRNTYTPSDHYVCYTFVWLIFICAWASDTGAYFVGKKFGKHKLTETLSPNKTVEGAIGGVIFASVASFVYVIIMWKIYNFEYFFIWLVPLIGTLGSVISQIGDLTASAIKRYTGIKDFGSVLPGHGGIIDRFDSVLFAAPAVYLLMKYLWYLW